MQLCQWGISCRNSVCPSVCLSARPFVRPSDTCVLCDKSKQCTADILIPHERAITLVFWCQQWSVGNAPSVWNLRSKWPILFDKCRLRHVSAYNVSTVRDGEKSSIMKNRKSITDFPTSYRRSADVKSPKGCSKAIFLLFWIKFNFNRIKSATKFLCVKTSSGKVVV